MKVCPQCQASFLEGYVYCPHDHALLEQYDLRAALRRRRQQELNFLLPTLSFTERLQHELLFAATEIKRHPWLFLKELLRGEGSSRQRLYLLQSGAALAVIAYTFVVTALLLWGVAYGIPTEQTVKAAPPPMIDEAIPLVIPMPPRAKIEGTRNSDGHLGGSFSQPQKTGGGGSGGRKELLPANGGVTPPPMLKEQIVLPSPHPPILENAKLVVTPHVVVDPASLKHVIGQIGIPNAPASPFSSGPGEGDGLGNRRGKGVGLNGDGDGVGPGLGRNIGGDKEAYGSRKTTGSGFENDVPMATGSMRPTITYREKARYTEEARQSHVQGSVILVATFTADGRITNIRSLKGLPHGLTEEALKAAARIRFNPAMRNGVPITVQARLEFQFNLY